MYKFGDEEMVFCPYNRYHMVSKLRIQKHIIKCKKNYPHVKYATCFYNYSHRLKPEDMLAHYEICSHKTRIDGSKYSEPYHITSSSSSVKGDPFAEEFPGIDIKPRIFHEPGALSSSSNQTIREGGESGRECVSDRLQRYTDDDDSDDGLEPLPLPKTVSKAFVYVKQKPKDLTSDTFQPKRFGRGKNFCPFSPAPSPTSVPDHKCKESAMKSQSKILTRDCASTSTSVVECHDTLKLPVKYLPEDCSESITSEMFEDFSTLISEDISISDDESVEEETANDDFIFTNFDKYVRI